MLSYGNIAQLWSVQILTRALCRKIKGQARGVREDLQIPKLLVPTIITEIKERGLQPRVQCIRNAEKPFWWPMGRRVPSSFAEC